MPQIILPPIALYNAERARLTERHSALAWFDRELKNLDPGLELVKVSEHTGGVKMRPGFWHIRRTDPDTGWQHYMVIEGPDGQFMEPHAGVIDRLRQHDLGRKGAFEEMLKQFDRADAARAKANSDWSDGLKQEFAERYSNKANAHVSMSGGWRNRARKA